MSLFSELITTVVDRLNADDYFALSGLRVLSENKGDFAAAIDESMQLGMLLVVSMGEITYDVGSRSDTVVVRLTGTEDIIKNRDRSGSGKPLLEVMETAWFSVCDQEWIPGPGWSPFERLSMTATEIDDQQRVSRGVEMKATITIRKD